MTIQASASFHITLSPQRRDDRLHLEKQGTALVINGEVVDLATYDASNSVNGWIVGHPEATENGWAVTVILPHGPSAPRATRFPAPIVASVDGPIEIPAYDGPDEDQELLDMFRRVQKLPEDKKRSVKDFLEAYLFLERVHEDIA